MKRMKRVVAIAAAAAMTASVMTGCGKSGGNEPAANHGGASGEVVSVDFWTAPQQVQYNFWESKAQAFNEAGITVDGKKIEVKVQQLWQLPEQSMTCLAKPGLQM